MRLKREAIVVDVESMILENELASIDGSISAVALRLARRMALIAKQCIGSGLSDVKSAASIQLGGVTVDTKAGLDEMSLGRLQARVISERSIHAMLIEQQALRAYHLPTSCKCATYVALRPLRCLERMWLSVHVRSDKVGKTCRNGCQLASRSF